MKEIVLFIKSLYTRLNYIVDKDLKYHFNFVMGNTGCDLDSLVSSIFYAFYKNLESGLISFPEKDEIVYSIEDNAYAQLNVDVTKVIYIPIINCNKGELSWRLDITELLEKMGLTENDYFIYYSDVIDAKNCSILFKLLKSK